VETRVGFAVMVVLPSVLPIVTGKPAEEEDADWVEEASVDDEQPARETTAASEARAASVNLRLDFSCGDLCLVEVVGALLCSMDDDSVTIKDKNSSGRGTGRGLLGSRLDANKDSGFTEDLFFPSL
jgi:hypothetical protein